MEVITIESQAFKELMAQINSISKFVLDIQKEKETEESINGWVDSFELCTFLKISTKTLQHLRTAGLFLISKFAESIFIALAKFNDC